MCRVVVVQSLSHVRFFVTPWTAACQSTLYFIISQSLLKLTSIELVMASNQLVLCHPLLLLPSVFPSIRVFFKESVKCWVGWITRWNQDCREKYQQPQICRWNHSNGRKWGRTKEPLDKGEKGEWKSSVKTQLLENSDHGMWSHHFMAYRWGNNGNSDKLYFLGLQNHCGRWQQPCD